MADAPARPVTPGIKPLMVPMAADDLEGPKYLRLLVMGFNKVGKSTCVIASAPKPVYVINSDQPDALEPVRRFDRTFLHNHVDSSQKMDQAIEVARQLVKDDRVQTVVWDTMSGFSPTLELEAFASTLTGEGKEDGRRAYPVYRKYLRAFITRLFKLKCHVVVITHYLDVGGGDDDAKDKTKKVAKTGQGIVPMLIGASRAEVGGMFQDVVFMEKRLTGPGTEERFFVTGIDGIYGPGCRSMPGNIDLTADVAGFLKLAIEGRLPSQGAPKKAVNGATVKPVPTVKGATS
jgi:AAA domain